MQTYPLISSYKTAVMISAVFDKLRHLRAVTDSSGQPIFMAGGPAVVFKMQDVSDGGKCYALKCFTRYQERRKEHYEVVSQYLKSLGGGGYLVDYTYYEREIWVDDSAYEVLLMDWVDGQVMSSRVAELCRRGDKAELGRLAARFDAMALWLLEQGMAHCDLKPDNIMITPHGDLRLVDYDGMYVPDLAGNRSPELGTAEYRHPRRTADDYGQWLDDFPILVLSLSLHSLAVEPSLYGTGGGDALVFRSEDYRSLLTSRHLPFFASATDNEVINTRFGLLLSSLSMSVMELPGLPQLLRQTAYVPKPLSTKIKRDIKDTITNFITQTKGITQLQSVLPLRDNLNISDILSHSYRLNGITRKNEYLDSSGAKLSLDKTVLIQYPMGVNIGGKSQYNIPDSIIVIEKGAFRYCISLTSINIPNSVRVVGDEAFFDCENLISITIPNSITSFGKWAFSGCTNLTSIIIPNKITNIREGTFNRCRNLTTLTIPNSVTSIGEHAFQGCENLTLIDIPYGVMSIPRFTFISCKNLTSITIPNSVTSIGESAFWGCENITSITIPNSVTSIGGMAFGGCKNITSITIPDSVTNIGWSVFDNCDSLKGIIVNKNNKKLIELLKSRGITNIIYK